MVHDISRSILTYVFYTSSWYTHTYTHTANTTLYILYTIYIYIYIYIYILTSVCLAVPISSPEVLFKLEVVYSGINVPIV